MLLLFASYIIGGALVVSAIYKLLTKKSPYFIFRAVMFVGMIMIGIVGLVLMFNSINS